MSVIQLLCTVTSSILKDVDIIFKTNIILYFTASSPGLSSYKGPSARWFGNFILKVPFPSPGIMANLTQLHQPEPERSAV